MVYVFVSDFFFYPSFAIRSTGELNFDSWCLIFLYNFLLMSVSLELFLALHLRLEGHAARGMILVCIAGG